MVDRFNITAAEQDPWIDADPSGQWVRYSDYAALEAKLAAHTGGVTNEAAAYIAALVERDEQARRWSDARRALTGGKKNG